MQGLLTVAYLVAAILFIMSLGGLSHQETARRGNLYGICGMIIAIAATIIFDPKVTDHMVWLVAMAIGAAIGIAVALKVEMTQMPQLVAMLHSFVGLAAVLVGFNSYLDHGSVYTPTEQTIHNVEIYLGILIGGLTFTGSIIAFGKLQGIIGGRPLLLPNRHLLNLGLLIAAIILMFVFLSTESTTLGITVLIIMTLLSSAFGVHMVMAIGGADMPVIVSMLNSYSGWAAAGIGFTLENTLLIITGALVGASGAILSYIMCKGMNRSFINVVLGGFGGDDDANSITAAAGDRPVKIGSAEDAGFIMQNASSVVIVPGYGMAVAQAQHAVREMADILKREGVNVRYAIHPVAGRMPGHMNVLLAEANVPYDEVLELEDINRDFAQTDVAFVIGANDITNPAAKTDPQSPIYGMPVLDVEKAKTVLFVKRSLGTGYAGVDNPLFFNENTMMLLGDAKIMAENIIKAME